MNLLLISDVSNFVKAKGYLVLFFDVHKNYLTAQEI